ncbi:hypothetical protein CBR_g5649 [Chara braunii]|uniref:Probable N-acetyl-gamma-glutamyl-phosphate reductase, chloroplastic n=1 Tax=Chara braunii TaxID=69332 RepID=A0A388JRR1_CHABU|nr:hypothetical protein CBR_g5649 [Chara braunii]|eukprot:GBG60475.1 hypothetical protein CBR_g5649 [Chara braunii]
MADGEDAREPRSPPPDPGIDREDEDRVKELMRLCYEEGILPTEIDPGEMTIEGREVRFKVNLTLDRVKIAWLKEHTVTIIFREGARFLPKKVKDDIVRAYEDEKVQDGSFEAEVFRRGRVKIEIPNVLSYVAKNKVIASWLVTKGQEEISIGSSTYRFDFKPWLTEAQLRDQGQDEDRQSFWVIAVQVPLDSFIYLEAQVSKAIGPVIHRRPIEPNRLKSSLINVKFDLEPDSRPNMKDKIWVVTSEGDELEVKLASSDTPRCQRCRAFFHTANECRRGGAGQQVNNQEGDGKRIKFFVPIQDAHFIPGQLEKLESEGMKLIPLTWIADPRKSELRRLKIPPLQTAECLAEVDGRLLREKKLNSPYVQHMLTSAWLLSSQGSPQIHSAGGSAVRRSTVLGERTRAMEATCRAAHVHGFTAQLHCRQRDALSSLAGAVKASQTPAAPFITNQVRLGCRWNGAGFAGEQLRLPHQQHCAMRRKRCGAIAAVVSPVSEKQMSTVGNSAKIGVLGASGYTGAEIVRLLAGHPFFRITLMTADRKAGLSFQNVFPHLGAQELPDLVAVKDADFDNVDAVFCCLPHGTTQEIIASLPKRLKVVDLSADFRLRNTEEYKQWYLAEHKAPELQEEAVYGLTELYRDEIKTARLVANPGCYPTTVQLALSPLLRDGLISSEGIVIDAKSGVSGAGRSAKESNLYSEVAEGMYAYGITNHRHVPEIEQGLADFAGKRMRVSFTPHLLPMIRGMQSTIYVEMEPGKTVDDLRERLQLQFQDEEFVTVMPKGGVPHTHYVRGSNYCLLGLFEDRIPGRAIIISVIDNLVKGASGQALQNMNLIMGVPENSGLQQQPLFP